MIRSMHEGLFGFIKQVGAFIKRFRLCTWQNVFIFYSISSELESLNSRTLSYFVESKSMSLLILSKQSLARV